MMLDDYKEKQPLPYSLLYKQISNGSFLHAYLFDENNCNDSFKFIMAFVKALLCEKKITNSNDCKNCFQCKKIDDGNYPEIKIIQPDGLLIKKNQIIGLQQEFSRLALEGNKKIYIIRDCEKMLPTTANSMLKFLEEPTPGIVAILMTNNFNNILPTIVSRCQIIKLQRDQLYEEDIELENIVLNFIENIEKYKTSSIINSEDLWFNLIIPKDREKNYRAIDIMIDMYYDCIKIKTKIEDIKYKKYFDRLCIVSDMNSEISLLNKINILVTDKDAIKSNVNVKLLIDSIIIEIGGIK